MWYAVTSKPLAAALAGVLSASVAVSTGCGVGSVPQVVGSTSVVLHLPVVRKPTPKVTLQEVPVSMHQLVVLPSRYRLSERGALEYLAHTLHIQLQFSGPDYAMIGEHLPYDRQVPAMHLLLQIANIPYIHGSFALIGDKFLLVHNTPLTAQKSGKSAARG
ncbi:hypothetical protein HMI48_11350 [Acidithiobacillus ferrooxidans]|uniref:hypothetical protein n=1 Tax=Acidithiobacillus ferrooxidans TaxID=920 RepID=UPI001C07DA96|nr:hypothetical protein [Acidithiobacillus ferrooxidans]MBU2774441.1 hypothetical protein [Acidithiobacillus ferrooxidans]